MTKRRTASKRSAPARALERAEHRHRVIPDKREIERTNYYSEQRRTAYKAHATDQHCLFDVTDKYNCLTQPCILCHGPR